MSVWIKIMFACAFTFGLLVVGTQLTLMILWELGYWDGPYQ